MRWNAPGSRARPSPATRRWRCRAKAGGVSEGRRAQARGAAAFERGRGPREACRAQAARTAGSTPARQPRCLRRAIRATAGQRPASARAGGVARWPQRRGAQASRTRALVRLRALSVLLAAPVACGPRGPRASALRGRAAAAEQARALSRNTHVARSASSAALLGSLSPSKTHTGSTPAVRSTSTQRRK